MAAFRRRLTYANVMSTLALFVALGGSSYAALTITGNNVKNGSITGADIKNGSLSALDLAMPNAPKQVSASERGRSQPRQAPSGPLATGSVAGAYGAVTIGGALNTGRSRNVVSVSRPRTGDYCITLAAQIDPSTTGLIVTPDYSNDSTAFSNSNHAIAEWKSGGGQCPPRTLQVSTGMQRSNGTIEKKNQGFFFSTGASGSMSGIIQVPVGQTRTVARSGALSLVASCSASSSGQSLSIDIYVRSTVPGAVMKRDYNTNGTLDRPDHYRQIDPLQEYVNLVGPTSWGGTTYFDEPLTAVAPDGSAFHGVVGYGTQFGGPGCAVVPQLVA